MFKFQLWRNADCWDAEQEYNKAVFHSAFDTAEEVADWCAEHKRVFDEEQTYEYNVMTDGEGDLPDAHILHIGTYTREEADSLMSQWEMTYAEEISHGGWINSVNSNPEYDLDLWNGNIWVSINPFGSREEIISAANSGSDVESAEEPLPIPE